MLNLLSPEVRRNPYPAYEQIREISPALHEPQSGLWMIFDYESVRRALTDHETFSSRHGPGWMIFSDPPRHTKLRALVSQAFTPRSIANLEPRIEGIARELLDRTMPRGQMDLVDDFALPLPIIVIAQLLGIPSDDQPRFKQWIDAMLDMSYTIPGSARGPGADAAVNAFIAITAQMSAYLNTLLEQRRTEPKDDLLTRLAGAQIDGQTLTHEEILGFFQLLLLAGQETTTNLISNTILCLIENPDQLALLRSRMDLLPSAIEETLRYRSPLQWMYRKTTRDVELHGQVIPGGKLVLLMLGSANRDPRQFDRAEEFDIVRNPNAHVAFGNGAHFCLGASLARLEARIALKNLLIRAGNVSFACGEQWEPRRGLNVHGPTHLPIQFDPL